MEKYDVLVIGAGMSGLYAALRLLQAKKKVLLLEKENYIGGIHVSKVAGRFEFEPCYQSLYIPTNEEISLQEVLREVSVPISFSYQKMDKGIDITVEENSTYHLPKGKEEFIASVEEYVPGSKESLENFFLLAEESMHAMEIVARDKENLDFHSLQEKYPNFVKTATYSVSKVLSSLEMPLKAQELLLSFWMYLGNSATELSFSQFAIFVYHFICDSVTCIKENTYTLLQALLSRYLELGGSIIYNSEVTSIETNGLLKKVFASGKEYEASIIIYNGLYEDLSSLLIDNTNKELAHMQEALVLSPSLYTISIGLNRSAFSLGLTNSFYFFTHSLDSALEEDRLKELYHGNFIVDVKELEQDSCILRISTLYKEHVYEMNDTKDLSEEIATYLIDILSKKLQISLHDYIEEYKIFTPYDFPHVFGYSYTKEDHLLGRIFHKSKEHYIPNMYCCSGFSGTIYGYAHAFYEARMVVEAILEGVE